MTASTGQTFVYGWCPGCNAPHRMDNCPDDHPERQEYCACCEAIRSVAGRAWETQPKLTTKRPEP